MALINESVCGLATDPKNWGLGECRKGRRERLAGRFVSLSPFSISADDAQDFETAVKALLNNADFKQRVQFLTDIEDITNDDADPTVFEFASGSRVQQRDRKYRHMLRVDSDCLHRAVRTWNGTAVYVLDVDKNGGIDGVKGTVDGEQVVSAYLMSRIFAEDMTQATMSDIAVYNISFEVANVEDLNLNHVHLAADKVLDGNGNKWPVLSNAPALVVQEVTITDTGSGNPATGVFDLAYHSGMCEENNLVTTFGATLATAARHLVTNEAGATITITTLTVGADGRRVRFDLDVTDPDYPASGGVIIFRQSSIADWATNGMEYFEVEPLRIVVP